MSAKSILLIEHEDSMREVLRISLSEFGGWKVALANSIQKGIEFCIASTPDVILLEASSPETDALLFIEELKQRSSLRSIPILLITARANWFTSNQLNEWGFAGAITKPFEPSALPTQIARLLGWNQLE